MDGVIREILPTEYYYAIVYEYVPDTQCALTADVLQAQLDFFWLSGFCLVPLRAENWTGPGILLDLADLICPWQAAWFASLYKQQRAREVTQNTDVQEEGRCKCAGSCKRNTGSYPCILLELILEAKSFDFLLQSTN